MIEKGYNWWYAQPLIALPLPSIDGIKLAANYLPAHDTKVRVLLLHGYHGYSTSDFAPVLQFYHESGYDILLVDQRAHGKSEGRYITFGAYEHKDCLSWIDYTNQQFGDTIPTFLHGLSMGCATVLMASGCMLPPNVKGVIADCGYTSPWDIMCHVAKRNYKLPTFPILDCIDLLCRLVAKFDLKTNSTLTALQTNQLPILFFHGEKDDFVPYAMGQANYEACITPKTFISKFGRAHV